MLKAHVVMVRDNLESCVRYDDFSTDRDLLGDYLGQMAAVGPEEFAQWPKPDRLAFLINAYNAWTIELILTRYPDLKSIKEMGSFFVSPWKQDFVELFGKTISLDELEHGMIRAPGIYDDPRIHFAVNCASISCPLLLDEAYEAEKLEQQLTAQTRVFLSNPRMNRAEAGQLKLSSIFKWYRKDFERGWLGYTSLGGFLADYQQVLKVPAAAQQGGRLKADFLPYNWDLNDCQKSGFYP